jgi:hypothetical protein
MILNAVVRLHIRNFTVCYEFSWGVYGPEVRMR